MDQLSSLFCRRQIRSGWHTIVYGGKRISVDIYTDLQVPNSFQHLSSFGAECISMWPLRSYRINLNISRWLIKKLSSKYNTSINLMTYFPLVPQGKFEFLPAKVALVWYVAVLGYLYWPGPNEKRRNQNPRPKLWRFRKSFRVGIRTFPNDYQHRWLFVPMVTNGHRPVEVSDTDRYQWPPGERPVEVYDTDRNQWPPGHHCWPMIVSAAEGRSLHRVGEKLRVP